MQTICEFDKQFGTDEQCRAFLVQMRWPHGKVTCPRCGNGEVFTLKTRAFNWVCKSGAQSLDQETGEAVTCHKRNGYRFSIITGTIFQDTKIKLNLWFKVGYLMLTAKKGISALQIHRVMFGEDSTHDYHTSWYMCMRWRAAMAGDMYQPLNGVVGRRDLCWRKGPQPTLEQEKRPAPCGCGRAALGSEKIGYGRVGVIGAIEHKGNVVARVIGSQDAPTLSGFVRNVVSDKVSLVVTDENQDYRYISRSIRHEAINHSRGEYVRGNIHTNSIESFWSLLKRA